MMTSTDDQLQASDDFGTGQSTTVKQRTVGIAYILGIPLGFTGAHHFYLGNYSLGLTYLLTLGLAGFGWIADWFRMKSLVVDANRANQARWRWENQQEGFRDENMLNYVTDNRKLLECYLMLVVTGVLGSHQMYLKRYGWGIAYFLTLGMGGAGYIMDWFRLPRLHRRYKEQLKAKSEGVEFTDQFYHLDDCYVCCIVLGVLGCHRFYLKQYVWGLLFFFTLGFWGIGWLIDMIRLKWIVERANHQIWMGEENRRLLAGQPAPVIYSSGTAYVGAAPTYVEKGGTPMPPPAATMHGYYFPAQAPGYQNLESQPQPPDSTEIGTPTPPPPPYTPVADAASALPESTLVGDGEIEDKPKVMPNAPPPDEQSQ
ncbi:uncharacterized protein [Amphiura filiformis]|uniref:uncharacterized protein n=1 Tax=Amphiura filiformis TaxID=82378 RepID=UPI003B20F483